MQSLTPCEILRTSSFANMPGSPPYLCQKYENSVRKNNLQYAILPGTCTLRISDHANNFLAHFFLLSSNINTDILSVEMERVFV